MIFIKKNVLLIIILITYKMSKTLVIIAISLLTLYSCTTKEKVSRPSFVGSSPSQEFKKKKK